MKYISRFKIFEAHFPDKMVFDAPWKESDHRIRKELVKDILDMALEVEDMGYEVYDGGWCKSLSQYPDPFIWIDYNEEGATQIEYDEVKDFIERVEDYLDKKGFESYKRVTTEMIQLFFKQKDVPVTALILSSI